MFEFNLKEKELPQLLGISLQTIKNWRNNGTLPDYLYRRFGGRFEEIRYCCLLLHRWQACRDEAERKAEEIWARAELIKTLRV